MAQGSCNNVLWEVYIGVSGQGGAAIGPPTRKKLTNHLPVITMASFINLT